jgi:RNA polymerase sigma-70 factor (ECF subfamily)
VRLEDQDRTLWDAARMAEGQALVERALLAGRVGPYQLQAAIAAVHDSAAAPADTDWLEILGLYEVLVRVSPSPVVALNRAVAVGEVRGPAAGLAAVDALAADPAMADYRFFHAARAELLVRLRRVPEARVAYDRALALAPNRAEAVFLERRRGEAAARASAG